MINEFLFPPELAGVLIVGLSGPQGTGKSTIAAGAARAMGDGVLVLSLDDFYLPRHARAALARRVSPLLATRGPPGTHDLPLLEEVLAAIAAPVFRPIRLPRFDKASDDRCPIDRWHDLSGRPKVVILEGWCVGATLAPDFLTAPPLNAFEAGDAGLASRAFQAEQLAGPYRALWDRVGPFVHLEAPDFDIVRIWRTAQEAQNLGIDLADLPAGHRQWVADFVQCFERITRDMARGFRRPGRVLKLDHDRQVLASHVEG